MNESIEIKGLRKTFGSFRLGPMDLEINKGSITVLLGNNGSGKTTLMKCICGQYVNENDNTQNIRQTTDLKKGFVFSECPYPESYKVKELAKVMSLLFSDWDDQRFLKLCMKLDIGQDKRIDSLSKGSKTKLQIAVNLSHDVDLLLLDEYSTGLDEHSKEIVLDEIGRFIDGSKTVIISTHDTSNIYQYADYVILLHNGKIVFHMDVPSIQDTFGIIRASSHNPSIDEEYIVSSKKCGYGKKYLIRNKKEVQRKYENDSIETASIQDILSFFSGGDVCE